jgi:hypothetical protein
MLNWEHFVQLTSFTYTGSTITKAANMDSEVGNRICKTSIAFGGLYQHFGQTRNQSHVQVKSLPCQSDHYLVLCK